MENTKRDLSLDFTKPRHIRGGGQPTPSLVTPNITLLGLSTPELNKMISGEELTVLTPNGISSVISQSTNVLPSPLIPTTINYNNNIINNSHTTSNNISNNSGMNTSNNNNITNNNNNLLNNHHHSNNNNSNGHIKRSDKPNRDLDIEKIEKKRERNRLAAKKCRQRKIETIDELKKTVSEWQQKHDRIQIEFERFKNVKNREIEQLTAQVNELKKLIR